MRNLCPPLYEARVSDWIRRHILVSIGVEEITPREMAEGARRSRCPDFARACRDVGGDSIEAPEFEALRHNRLLLGHSRYGVTGRGPYDRIGSAISRLRKFQLDSNLEHLVDSANLIELEWITPSFEGTYYNQGKLNWFFRTKAVDALRWYLSNGNRVMLVFAYLQVADRFAHQKSGDHLTPADDGEHTRELP